MSNHKKSRNDKYIDLITFSIKKKTNNYHVNAVGYVNIDKLELLKGSKKIIEFEKTIQGDIGKIEFNRISSHYVGCSYTITIYDTKVSDNLIDKFRIKNVDMDKLIDDLNNNGIHVNKLLNELTKNNFNLDNITEYFSKNNIELTNLMMIINRHGVNLTNIIENPFIYNMIKKSSYAWFLQDKKISSDDNKLSSKKIHIYTIYNIVDDSNIHITTIQWTLIK